MLGNGRMQMCEDMEGYRCINAWEVEDVYTQIYVLVHGNTQIYVDIGGCRCLRL